MFHMDNLKIKRQNFLISTPGQFFEIKRQNSFIFTPGRIGVWQLHKQVAGPRHTLAHLKLFFLNLPKYGASKYSYHIICILYNYVKIPKK